MTLNIYINFPQLFSFGCEGFIVKLSYKKVNSPQHLKVIKGSIGPADPFFNTPPRPRMLQINS